MRLRTALVVPSMFAGPDDHWYPDLRRRLSRAGFEDIRTATPPAGEPALPQWLEAIAATGMPIDGETLVVGHSLGAVAALAHLSAAGTAAVGAFVGVAGFVDPLTDLESSAEFCAAVDLNRMSDVILRRDVLVSSDDYGVPPANTEAWADRLRAKLHRVEAAGHFLARDGWTTAGLVGDLAVRA